MAILYFLSQPLRFAYRVLLHCDVGLNLIHRSALLITVFSVKYRMLCDCMFYCMLHTCVCVGVLTVFVFPRVVMSRQANWQLLKSWKSQR